MRTYIGTGGDYARSYGYHHSDLLVRDNFFLDISDHYADPALVLDLGCGSAELPMLMAERHPSLSFICTDLDQANIDIAKKTVRRIGLEERFQFVCCSAEDLTPIKPNSVDFGMACGVVSYCSDPVGVVAQLLSKVRRGGSVRFDLSTRSAGEWLGPLSEVSWAASYTVATEEMLSKIESLSKIIWRLETGHTILYELKRD